MTTTSIRSALTFAAAVAALGLTGLALAPVADAAPAHHCSGWKQAGQTKYYVRECAQLVVTTKSGRVVKQTVYLRNTGTLHSHVTVTTEVDSRNSGGGSGYPGVTVAPGKSKMIKTATQVGAGPYRVAAEIDLGGRNHASVAVRFTK